MKSVFTNIKPVNKNGTNIYTIECTKAEVEFLAWALSAPIEEGECVENSTQKQLRKQLYSKILGE